MKLTQILIIILFLTIGELSSQNLFFINDESYPSTETFILKSDAGIGGHNLEVAVARKGENALLALSTRTMTGVLIRDKINLYLVDGTVLSLSDKKRYDYVNKIATTIYDLSAAEIEKLKNVNIHTIRFSLKCGEGCTYSTEEGVFTASNKHSAFSKNDKTNVPAMVKSLFP